MPEMLRLMGSIALIIVGWLVARSDRTSSRRIWYAMLVVTLLAFAAVVVTGLTNQLEFSATWHRWLGHGLVIVHWQAVPLGIGMVIGAWWPHRRWMCVATTLLLGASLGFVILSSITGYLGPSHGHSDQETLRRFFVLHQVVLPSLLGISLLLFLWIPLQAQRSEMPPIDDGDASN